MNSTGSTNGRLSAAARVLTGTSQDDLVALVELVGLAGREDERHECRRTRRRMLLASVVRTVAPHHSRPYVISAKGSRQRAA
jgi:hypothetical protein